MLRKILVYNILFLIGICVFGQKSKPKNDPTFDDRPIHFGFALGLNYMDFSFKRDLKKGNGLVADIAMPIPGFQVNTLADFRLNRYFNIRLMPGVSFGNRHVDFKNINSSIDTIVMTAKVSSSFIEMPSLIKYRSKRINNFAPYLIGGLNPRWDFDSKEKQDKVNLIILNHFDLYCEFGVGLDFYNPDFKFSSELKFSYGLTDVLNHRITKNFEKYTYSLVSLHSKIIMFTIYFE